MRLENAFLIFSSFVFIYFSGLERTPRDAAPVWHRWQEYDPRRLMTRGGHTACEPQAWKQDPGLTPSLTLFPYHKEDPLL